MFKFVEMEKDSHSNVMMETISTAMVVVQIAKLKLVLLAMEEAQIVKMVAQNTNHKKLNLYKQDKHICMEK